MEDRRRKEDKKLIDEYMEKEIENCVKSVKTMVEKAERGEEVSFADFCPEWNLGERMPYTHYDPTIAPLWVMLPYYNTVIVDIFSHFSEQEFRKVYGCGIEGLLKLEKERKVVLSLVPFSTRGISDYLYPYFEEGLEEGRPSLLRATLPIFLAEKSWKESIRLFSQRFPEGRRGWSAEELENSAAGMYFGLKFFGFDQVAEYIKGALDLDPYLAYDILRVYYYFLVGPKVYSLDGIHPVSREMIEYLSSLPPGISSLKTEKYEIFPYDVGKVLVKKAKLVVQEDLEDALDVYKDYEKARKALFSLEKAVEEKENILERAEALKKTWNELVSMEEMKGKLSVAFTTVGLVGSLAAEEYLSQQPDLLSHLLKMFLPAFRGVVLPIIAPRLAERTVKIGKSSNIVVVYDFVRERNPEAFRDRNIDL